MNKDEGVCCLGYKNILYKSEDGFFPKRELNEMIGQFSDMKCTGMTMESITGEQRGKKLIFLDQIEREHVLKAPGALALPATALCLKVLNWAEQSMLCFQLSALF